MRRLPMHGCCILGCTNEPRRKPRQGTSNESAPPRHPRDGVWSGCASYSTKKSKRLSATDISALASMKNVAKCDTWCELQNPVNHQVFERKLRPKPLGRGHVCLGVTQCCPPNLDLEGGGRMMASRASRFAVGRNASPRRRVPQQSVVLQPSVPSCVCGSLLWTDRPQCAVDAASTMRPQVRRDHPLSLSISISGGKETYKDSPSNGERTGNSPG